MEAALGGQLDWVRDEKVDAVVERVRAQEGTPSRSAELGESDLISVHADRVQTEEHREAGPEHVGHQMWKRLGLDPILAKVGFSVRARILTEVMVLNRLVFPLSEHAMPDWVRRSAIGDILGVGFESLCDDALYRHLDRLHPQRVEIEKALAERERTLFNLEDSILLYDLTSTYSEGQCAANPQAKRGYSRDHRPDCKQVVVGLVLDREGFPKAQEIFDGNRTDRSTIDHMLDVRTGRKKGVTVVVDRGMAFDDNLKQIKKREYHYLVASRQGERNQHLDDFEDEQGWTEIVRTPSPTNLRTRSLCRLGIRVHGSGNHRPPYRAGSGCEHDIVGQRPPREQQERPACLGETSDSGVPPGPDAERRHPMRLAPGFGWTLATFAVLTPIECGGQTAASSRGQGGTPAEAKVQGGGPTSGGALAAGRGVATGGSSLSAGTATEAGGQRAAL
jgi:hypothetical protein